MNAHAELLAVIPESGALSVTIPEQKALAFFTTEGAVDPVLAAIRKEIDGFKGDATTAKGRKEIASMAFKVAQSKTYLESVGKELASAQKEIPKKIDASRKLIRDTLDRWRDEVREPLTEWEAAEEARVKKHRDAIELLAGRGDGFQASADLNRALSCVLDFEIGPVCEEFEADYLRAKDSARARLVSAIAAAEKRESEQAELERLRRESAWRAECERVQTIRQEAVERATAEAESRALAARQTQEAREIHLRREKEDAERRAAETEARIKREAKEAKDREDAETRRREEDRTHRAKINSGAFLAFVAGGLTEEAAKLAVTLIAKREIPNVAISY